MPVVIPSALPAGRELAQENIFVMDEQRAGTQDIRPLRIAILNLMPTKLATERQLLRLVGNTALQVQVTFLYTDSYRPTHTDASHLEAFYQTFETLGDTKYDGLIVTGAPVEQMPFEQVQYWRELRRVMAWARSNVFSTLYICWAAQAALYDQYGIGKVDLPQKLFGVFRHRVLQKTHPLARGFDDVFWAPHSRHTAADDNAIRACPELDVIADSQRAGVYLCAARDGRSVFVTGHSEYDADTLALEYRRDVSQGLPIAVPENYFTDDDPQKPPLVRWRSHGNLLLGNWLNYFVYQETPYNLQELR